MEQNDCEMEDESDSRQTNPAVECVSDELIIRQPDDSSDDADHLPLVLPESF